jgi:hypothetical protein
MRIITCGTYANPKAMMAQTPTFTFRLILIFQRKMVGRIDKVISVTAAIAAWHRLDQWHDTEEKEIECKHTSLGDSNRVDSFVRPAVSGDRLVPVQLHGGALGEDGSGVKQARDRIEGNETPEEVRPAFVCRAVKCIYQLDNVRKRGILAAPGHRGGEVRTITVSRTS